MTPHTLTNANNTGLLPNYMQAMESVSQGVLWLDEYGTILGANTAFLQDFNLLSVAFITQTLFSFTPSFSFSDWQKHWNQLLKNKQIEIKIPFSTVPDTYRSLPLCCTLIETDTQSICCAIVPDTLTAKDLSIAWHCLDNKKEIIYWLNDNGDFQFVNKYMCELLGYSREEILGKKFKALRADFNETRWHYQWEEFRKGSVLESEVKFKHRDGREIPVKITGYYLRYQGQEIACIFGKDRRKSKHRDEILRLTRYSLNHTQEMVYWIREDGSFYYFNDAFASKLGYTTEEVQLMHLLDFFPTFKSDDFEHIWQRLRSGEIMNQEMKISHRNGFMIPVQTYVTLLNLEGETFACGILSDISERKRKEAELQSALEEVKKKQTQYALNYEVLKQEIALEHPFTSIISTTGAYNKVLKQVEQIAPTDATVLLRGEIGTGKKLLAQALHQRSPRRDHPFIKIHCHNTPLLESALFGHEKDAFPGAFQQQKGALERANGGTIFLEEVGALSLPLQGKLLHVLQEGTLKRMGSTELVATNIRVIASTTKDLALLVENDQFRQDLFYRLHIFSIYNLPLRERRQDILPLAQYFVRKFSQNIGKPIPAIPQQSLDQLKKYNFPGNVLELENIIERAVLLTTGTTLHLENLVLPLPSVTSQPLKSMEQMQRDHILDALRRTKGQVTGENGAAKLLKMNDKTLYSKMQKLKIERADYLQ